MRKKNVRPIGGEFAIAPSLLEGRKKRALFPFAVSSGRAGLFTVLRHLKCVCGTERLLVPDYLCHVILRTARDAGVACRFYPLDRGLHPERAALEKLVPEKAGTALLLINYFGLQDIEQDIRFIRGFRPEARIVLDNVQAFYEMGRRTGADFAFTSFRKMFPVPDGGFIKGLPASAATARTGVNISAFYKTIGGLIKHMRDHEKVDDGLYLGFLKEGEEELDRHGYYDAPVSRITENILPCLDRHRIAQQRTRNFLYLKDRLARLGLRPVLDLKKGKVPLFFPILIRDRNRVRQGLMKEDIFCPVHWPVDRSLARKKMTGTRFERAELSLVIDQRYGKKDMSRMAESLEKLNVESADQ